MPLTLLEKILFGAVCVCITPFVLIPAFMMLGWFGL